MTFQRPPIAPLRPFISLVWAAGDIAAACFPEPRREHVLPTGAMHLVFRLNDTPLHLVARAGQTCNERLGDALVGGARSGYYVRALHAPSCSVGVVLRPGASALLFGVGAHELAERHTSLRELWGVEAEGLRQQLLEAPSNEARLALLEAALAVRLPRARALHPAIASALAVLASLHSVQAAVRQSGLSHRRFIDHFRSAVGLTPKSYMRVLRFQQALAAVRNGTRGLADIAADNGYSDQAHLSRDFRDLTGVTPAEYRRYPPPETNHLPAGHGLTRQVCSRHEAARA